MSVKALRHQVIALGERTIDLFEPEGLFGADEVVLDSFLESVRQLLSSGRNDIRVGCGSMTMMNSIGLGMILRVWVLTRERGGRFALDPQGNRRIRNLMAMTKLPLVDDPADGMAGKAAPLIPPPTPSPLLRAQQEEPAEGDPDRNAAN